MLEDQLTKAAVEVGKDVAEDVLRPSSKAIGEHLGIFVDGVMGWLSFWGEKQRIKRQIYLDDYKQKITSKVNSIPQDNLIEPDVRIVGPALESSKYHIEKEEFRELFAQLIASSCNSTKSSSIHPAFPEIITQLSSMDARFLYILSKASTLPAVEFYIRHSGSKITSFPYLIFGFTDIEPHFSMQEELDLSVTIENLIRLGLILKNSRVLKLNYDYEQFKNHWLYLDIQKQDKNKGDSLLMHKYRVELTPLGKAFISCCF